MIKSRYSANELENYKGSLPCALEGSEEAEEISLSEAAKRRAPWNAFNANICMQIHNTRKCCCYKQEISCSRSVAATNRRSVVVVPAMVEK